MNKELYSFVTLGVIGLKQFQDEFQVSDLDELLEFLSSTPDLED